MDRADYLANEDVQRFVTWLSHRISGAHRIDFRHGADPAAVFSRLGDALLAYAWPPNQTNVTLPDGSIRILHAGATLAQNDAVLGELQAALRACLGACPVDEALLERCLRGILRWGGLEHRNEQWLATREGRLHATLAPALAAFAGDSDDLSAVPELRSNASLTKLYSLALPDFIIYDSRVAAALAWLALRWSVAHQARQVPQLLRFICPAADNGPGVRTPDRAVFPKVTVHSPSSHRRHARWNVRANWILSASFGMAQAAIRAGGPKMPFQTLRDVEAALFVMGADLTEALQHAEAAPD